ncbi:MAG: hypothetical protein A2Y62_14425 [Candidatus Fischerbacteria bacterium RBG_13_37_8]|uniref:Type II secretion system protein GspG C-terminal domain-containing protein n=1 Tax=Candidatus Fischerbacteria bacterium RBG_13_37_8 TaxID=1817863 RepID=A0A1F5VNN6_9BACT|nr:MAG: hypothetical protein A2Y62_14425 [Candidatus Fischerbacteria bacterium RBG_13_37_8]
MNEEQPKIESSAFGGYKRPGIVTLLSIIEFFVAAVWIIISIALIIGMVHSQYNNFMYMAIVAIALGIINFFCGYGLWNLKSYGRTIMLVFSFIGLLGFPFGTIISILLLIYFYKPGIKIIFSQRDPATLTADEIRQVTDLQSSNPLIIGTMVVILMSFAIPIIGIIAAIAIPNFLNARDRARQIRTRMEIQNIAAAVESYKNDHNAYPETLPVQQLQSLLVPKYIDKIYVQDAWKNDFRYIAWKENPESVGPDNYIIASAGKDGVWEENDMKEYTEKVTCSFRNDIVLKNNVLIQQPQGPQMEADPAVQCD